jgi:hypothetical protein
VWIEIEMKPGSPVVRAESIDKVEMHAGSPVVRAESGIIT